MKSRTRRTAEAQMEHQAVQDDQYLGSGSHQRDLGRLWWKPWNEQGFASSLIYGHLEETKRHADREAEPRTSKQDLHRAPGEKGQENKINVQQLIPLGVEPNSALGNANLGVSYDSILAKGPCSLTPLVAALERWRILKRELAWDLSRAHNMYDLLRILAYYDFRPTGACYPRPRSDADKQHVDDNKPAVPGDVHEGHEHLA